MHSAQAAIRADAVFLVLQCRGELVVERESCLTKVMLQLRGGSGEDLDVVVVLAERDAHIVNEAEAVGTIPRKQSSNCDLEARTGRALGAKSHGIAGRKKCPPLQPVSHVSVWQGTHVDEHADRGCRIWQRLALSVPLRAPCKREHPLDPVPEEAAQFDPVIVSNPTSAGELRVVSQRPGLRGGGIRAQ